MPDLILSPAEVEALTGGLKRPADQLRELTRMGIRAWRRRGGPVRVIRAHLSILPSVESEPEVVLVRQKRR